ncbi:MAG: DUF1294 domain-containing protein [Rhodobacteraceae bacterium]|nr:DUF1294 domain-containing protein [Paracoccaceae bacterium]
MESVAFASDMTLRVLVFGGAYFVGINLLAVLLFWMDKRRARRGDWRIPERQLLGVMFWGGTPGGLWARRVLRHKTRKEPFCTHMQVIVSVQIVVVGALVVLWTQPDIVGWTGTRIVMLWHTLRASV